MRRGARATRLATILVVLAAALLVPSAAAAKSEFFGIVQGPSLDDKDLVGLQRAHIHTVRYLLAWESIQPRSGSKFSWGSTNKFIGRLAAKGIRVLPSVWGNPSWVQGYTAHPPLDRPQDLQAWRNFLKALVAHYGPGGKYWTTTFKTKYPGATPLPITTWQIWNEPNLKKYFTPYPAPKLYGRLLKASHDAIKSKDPKAQVALAGMPGYGDVNAWDFLNQLYNQVASVKSYFEVASLHPYGPNIDKVKSEIQKFRDAMTSHADRATPLWITELGWGSAPPDRFGINKGPQGQAKMLKSAYKTILANRKTWNVQRLFWYHWRDPKSSHANCSFCASAGLIKFNRTAKPALAVFKSFTAETTPPTASITGGPSQGATITNPTPTFKFTSNEPGSTFECKLDAGSFTACSSPFKTPHLANGAHTFQVRAIDAPGNVGAPASRSFNVNAP